MLVHNAKPKSNPDFRSFSMDAAPVTMSANPKCKSDSESAISPKQVGHRKQRTPFLKVKSLWACENVRRKVSV